MTVITASPKGFQKLLDLQQQSLTSLNSIQDILSTNTDSITQQLMQSQLDLAKQSLELQQKQKSLQEDANDNLQKLTDANTKAVTDIAGTLKNTRSWAADLHAMKKSFTDTFMGGNFTKSLMDAFNVGGIFNKKIAKADFIKSQVAAGADPKQTKLLEKNFEVAYKLAKDIEKNEAAIKDWKKAFGRGRDVSDDEMAQNAKGATLLGKRGDLAGSYAAVDMTAGKTGKGAFSGDQPSAPLPKTPSDFGQVAKSTSTIAAETAGQKETDNETAKVAQTTNDLLQQIADNTLKMAGGKGISSNTKKAGGGLMDSISDIFSSFGTTFMNVIKNVFSFRSILKFVTKFFAPAMIIASLANGIIDGFKTFMETGDIGEALIAGFGGVLEFLSFGLFDKETLRSVVDGISSFVDDYITKPVTKFINGIGDAFSEYIAKPIKSAFDSMMDFAQNIQQLFVDTIITPIQTAFAPISDFFGSMADSVLNTLKSIQIPGISFKIPFKDDPVTLGPWNPFGDNKQDDKNVSQVTPTSGNKVINASKENADGKAATSGGAGNTNTVISAPVQNNQNTTQVVNPSVRNTESSQSRYLSSRY